MAGLGSSSAVEEGGEPDYMADLSLFVSQPEDQGSAEPHVTLDPLPRGKLAKGKPWQKRRVEQQRQVAATEATLREAGLNTAIPANNIGFKLLQQMGYKPGEAVGRGGQGRVQPVEVDLKVGRGGLGKDEEEREERRREAERFRVQEARRQRNVRQLEEEYRDTRRGKWEGRKIGRHVVRARIVLAQLDEQNGVSQSGTQKKTKVDEDEDDLWDEDEGFVRGMDAARRKKRRRLEEERARAQGRGNPREKEDEDKDEGVGEGEEEEEDVTPEMLQELLDKLRNVYHYCLYCGFQYSSKEDMEAGCPGEDEEGH